MKTYTNYTIGKMKIYDDKLKKVIILQPGESYKVGSSEPTKTQIIDRPKPPTDKSFRKELRAIKGIGNETVKDIINVYPTKAHLISAIKKGDELSFRNDVAKKLQEVYNG